MVSPTTNECDLKRLTQLQQQQIIRLCSGGDIDDESDSIVMETDKESIDGPMSTVEETPTRQGNSSSQNFDCSSATPARNGSHINGNSSSTPNDKPLINCTNISPAESVKRARSKEMMQRKLRERSTPPPSTSATHNHNGFAAAAASGSNKRKASFGRNFNNTTPSNNISNRSKKRAVRGLNGGTAVFTGRSNDFCEACKQTGRFICCDSCPRVFHFMCIDPPLDEDYANDISNWYCSKCRPLKPGPKKMDRHNPLFPLYQALEKRNPTVFSVPENIRKQFDGVEEGSDGEYINPQENRPIKTLADADRSSKRLTDERGETLLCYKCDLSALHGLIIRCDYCPLVWHWDCLDPPLSSAPQANKKWMCPNHADHAMPRVRRFKKEKVVDLTSQPIDTPNNGRIEIIDDDSIPMVSYRYQLSDPKVRYKIPASSIKHQFFKNINKLQQNALKNTLSNAKSSRPNSMVEKDYTDSITQGQQNTSYSDSRNPTIPSVEAASHSTTSHGTTDSSPSQVWDWLRSVVSFQQQVAQYLMQADPMYHHYQQQQQTLPIFSQEFLQSLKFPPDPPPSDPELWKSRSNLLLLSQAASTIANSQDSVSGTNNNSSSNTNNVASHEPVPSDSTKENSQMDVVDDDTSQQNHQSHYYIRSRSIQSKNNTKTVKNNDIPNGMSDTCTLHPDESEITETPSMIENSRHASQSSDQTASPETRTSRKNVELVVQKFMAATKLSVNKSDNDDGDGDGNASKEPSSGYCDSLSTTEDTLRYLIQIKGTETFINFLSN
ncbi:hypothetical protein H4219_001085 [Mycoemilia scoparia]|uniref:PHD-type domain-containing protein n=1 Tax=Mycoemilia scoparia TaxID=417184 RepID=A0A9W8A6Y3_9FUNG|nr:hypothetical protein H4219_001085 [Mycoemilia scoparia]